MRTLITTISIIALVLAVAACQGDAGPAGEQGPPGPQGPAGDIATEAPAAVPPRWEPAEYTKYVVRAAIRKYDSEGLDATVAHYNTRASIDGQWYVFIGDQDDIIRAHANPDLVDRPASEAVGPHNYPAGEAVVAVADEDGAWFSYTFTNPASGAVEVKHSWIVEYDGLTFGSGWYERAPGKSDAPAYTRTFVGRAIALYDAIGREDTVAYYNTTESVDDQWYVFIVDQDDIIRAHANPDLVDRPASEAVGPHNYPAGEAVVAVADEDGAWFSYTFTNPASGAVEVKHSWIVEYDGLTFGSG